MIPTNNELEIRIVLLENQVNAMHKTIIAQADLLRRIVQTFQEMVPMGKRKWKATDIVGEYEEDLTI